MKNKKITIGSSSNSLYTTKRLLEEAVKLHYEATWINPYHFALPLSAKRLENSREHFYFHRTTGVNYDDFDLNVTMAYENLGYAVINPLSALKLFRNKDTAWLYLNERENRLIPSIIFRGELTEELTLKLSKLSHKNEYVLKMNRGNQGVGVTLVKGFDSLLSLLETFHAMKDQRFIIQPMIPFEKEWRLFFIKDRLIAQLEKKLTANEFRANAKRADVYLSPKIPAELEKFGQSLILQSGLDYAGIDIGLCDDGYKLIEINAIPGFESIEKITSLNIARELITQLAF